MGAEVVYADSQISGSITTPANALGSTAGTWAGTVNANVNTTDLWSMENPVLSLLTANTQTITVRARKGSNTGTPTLRVDVYEGATLRQSGVTTNITSTTGQDVSVTFDGTAFVNNADLRVETVITGVGGAGSVRNSVQIDYIRANLDTTAPTQVGNGTGSTSWGFSASATGSSTHTEPASQSWGFSTSATGSSTHNESASASWGFSPIATGGPDVSYDISVSWGFTSGSGTTTLLEDTFDNGADGGSVMPRSGYTEAGDGGWTFYNPTGTAGIIYTLAGSSFLLRSLSGDGATGDWRIDLDIKSNGNLGNLIFGYVDTNNFMLWAQVVNESKVKLYKVIGGVFTNIGEAAYTYPNDAYSTFRTDRVGDELRCYVNDVLKVTHTLTPTEQLAFGDKYGIWAEDAANFDNLKLLSSASYTDGSKVGLGDISVSWGNNTSSTESTIRLDDASLTFGFTQDATGSQGASLLPPAVTDLFAVTGGAAGEVVLTWSAPV